MSWLKTYLLNLNIFKASSSDTATDEEIEHDRRSNQIATRIFLVILIIILLILAWIFRVTTRTTIVTLEKPTKDQVENLSVDVYCPCSQMTLSYGDFTSIQTTTHEVCASEFISDRWIQAINSGSNVTYYYTGDFRTSGSAMFQALASLCRLTRDHVSQSIALFYQQSLISPTVLSKSAFQSEVSVSLERLQLTASKEFATQLQLLQILIAVNEFSSGLQTNVIHPYSMYPGGRWYVARALLAIPESETSWCQCSIRIDCSLPSEIFNVFGEPTQLHVPDDYIVFMTIPGIIHSCLPVNAILHSTLECFYNQTCLDTLVSFFPTSETFLAMPVIGQSRFQLNSKVQAIVDDLMVEKWITSFSHEKYYSQCAPLSCSYSKNMIYDWTYVLKKLISLLSGLVLVLGFIVPRIVRFLRRPRNRSATAQRTTSLFQRIKTRLIKTVSTLNMFQHHGSNQYQIKYQQMATRLYIILLLISIIILSLYTLVIEDIHQKTVYQPSELQYKRLQQTYSDHLFCSCSAISMNYSTFIKINISFHQICSSDFVSQQWIDYNTPEMDDGYYFMSEYRTLAASQFQLLAMFCQQAKQIVNDSLELFYESTLFSSQVTPQGLLESRFNSSTYEWFDQTLSRFLRMIKLFRATSHGNFLSTGMFNVLASTSSPTNREVKIGIRSYSNCSCALSPSCVVNMGIYEANQTNRDTPNQLLLIPNFFIGCFPMEALLKSTLQCFYNRSCMLEIDQYLPKRLGSSFNFSALNENLTSPYETIESIISKLMIHSWLPSISYSSYYQTCAPQSCTYEYMSRNSLFYVLTTIFGAYGGLSLGWKILFLIILRFVEKMMDNFSFQGLRTVIRNVFRISNKYQLIRRLHFVFLLVLICVIFNFSAYNPKLVTAHIDQPSLSVYEQLSTDYSNTLQCSCSHISISYRSFVNLRARMHHLCSSDFVSNQWIKYLYGRGNLMNRFTPSDYRLSSTGQFLLLSSLCQLSEEIINDTRQQLFTRDFISSRLLSSDTLNQQIQATISQFQLTTPNLLLSILNMIREITGSNALMSGWSTNWKYITERVIRYDWTAHTAPIAYQGCDCGSSWTCTQPSGGMMVGCYALEALLQLRLQCFYDQDCIDINRTFTKLDMSMLDQSQFKLNTTIQTMLTYLMVEEYQSNVSYSSYFLECAPSSCAYSYVKSHDIAETIISLISLYGGLFILTQCLAVIVAQIYYSQRNRVHPEEIVQST